MMTALMIAIIVLSNAAGDVLITRGMKGIGEVTTLNPRELLSIGRQVITDKDFVLGILSLAISFFSFLTILTWEDMSFVVPVTSVYYVVSILGAKFILREEISRLRWAGTLLVCVGVALVCLP